MYDRTPTGGWNSFRTKVCAAQAHSLVKKACMIAGITHCRLIRARIEDDWALDPASVAAVVEADKAAGLIPFFLCATVGTTSSSAVDPLRPLGELSQQHGLWCVACLVLSAVQDKARCHSGAGLNACCSGAQHGQPIDTLATKSGASHLEKALGLALPAKSQLRI